MEAHENRGFAFGVPASLCSMILCIIVVKSQ